MVSAEQYEELSSIIHDKPTSTTDDIWLLIGSIKGYSSKRIYRALPPSALAPKPVNWIWKSCVLPKIKIFFLLLLQDRLNTIEVLTSKRFSIQSQLCALCEYANVEDFIHLIFASGFSQRFVEIKF
jgi:hypothetical protein